MKQERVLITGASGQLGTVLTKELQQKWGDENVIATDLRQNDSFLGCFEVLDVLNYEVLEKLVTTYEVTQIYHLAAILSVKGEEFPLETWDINMKAFLNVLEVSRIQKVNKVFFPSSIAVFGDKIQRVNTPQNTIITPTTVYGISKVAGENWGNYYFEKYGLDIRSVRYPGVVGYQSLPGGGTTDYAVDIYHKAVQEEPFECFLSEETILPMIYMEDAIRATIELMDAPKENITVRTAYNLAGMSFSPAQLATSISEYYPEFEINYKPDYRQAIADSWPQSIDDHQAVVDWGWSPRYNLQTMTEDMITNLIAVYIHDNLEN